MTQRVLELVEKISLLMVVIAKLFIWRGSHTSY